MEFLFLAKRGEQKANGFAALCLTRYFSSQGFLSSNPCHILQYVSISGYLLKKSKFPSSQCLLLGSSNFLSVPKHACFSPAAFVLGGR